VRAIPLAALLLLAASTALAHGDLHDQIRAVTRAIADAPADATLYLQRGELHRAHHAPRLARADFDRALTLDPALDAARLARARLLVETSQPREALADLDGFLTRHPDHHSARLVRARARRALGDRDGALADYDRVLAESPNPDRALERARLMAAPGDVVTARAAVDGLDLAIARLGPLVTLELEAVAVLERAGDIDAALARLDRAAAGSPRADRWLTRRADLLDRAGRFDAARQARQAAADAQPSTPTTRQTSLTP
jgi:tetratricopeptide (TPR) repeat protein